MLFRKLPINNLQIFCKIILNYNVIFRSITGSHDNCKETLRH